MKKYKKGTAPFPTKPPWKPTGKSPISTIPPRSSFSTSSRTIRIRNRGLRAGSRGVAPLPAFRHRVRHEYSGGGSHRHRPGSGKDREIDVFGAAGAEQWVCQSKWIEGCKTGIGVLKRLFEQSKALKDEEERRTIRMWMFSNDGLTRRAEDFAEKNGIFWSACKEFDELMEHLGLRRLPDV